MAFETTFEQAVLIDSIAKGDVAAVADLWLLLFGKPLDPKRPFQEIIDEIAAKISPPKTEAEIAKERAEAAIAKATEIWGPLLDAVFKATDKPKRKT